MLVQEAVSMKEFKSLSRNTNLATKKLRSARLVPRLPRPDQKRTKNNKFSDKLLLFEGDPDTFSQRFVTGDEI